MSTIYPQIVGALAATNLGLLVAFPGPVIAAMFAFTVANFMITLVTYGRGVR